MANPRYSRQHPGIGLSAMQRIDPSSRSRLTPAQLIDSLISDVEWANHRHKLVGEALRGLHTVGVELHDAASASTGDLAALHAVFGEFVLILSSEMDDAVAALRHAQAMQAGVAAA